MAHICPIAVVCRGTDLQAGCGCLASFCPTPDSFFAHSCSSKWFTVSIWNAKVWKLSTTSKYFFWHTLPVDQHTPKDDKQYSPSLHDVVVPHEAVAWQVRGPPRVSPLQDVKPINAEQSDVTAQNTKMWEYDCHTNKLNVSWFWNDTFHCDKYLQNHKTVQKSRLDYNWWRLGKSWPHHGQFLYKQ